MDDKTMNMLLERITKLESTVADTLISLDALQGRVANADVEIIALRQGTTRFAASEPDTNEAAKRRDKIEKQVRGK